MDEALLGRKADDDAENGAACGKRHQWERHNTRGLVRVVVEMVVPRSP